MMLLNVCRPIVIVDPTLKVGKKISIRSFGFRPQYAPPTARTRAQPGAVGRLGGSTQDLYWLRGKRRTQRLNRQHRGDRECPGGIRPGPAH